MTVRRWRRDLALTRRLRELAAENVNLRALVVTLETENVGLVDDLVNAMARNAALAARLEAPHA